MGGTTALGPHLRMRNLQPAELPQHPDLAELQTTGTAPEPRVFAQEVLTEARAFVKEYWSKLSVKSASKPSPPSTATVELLAKDISASELPSGCSKESWFARKSIHENKKATGTADWSEFESLLFDNHSQHESEYTPDIYDAHRVLDWDSTTLSEVSGWERVEMHIYEMCHALPGPMSPRTFSVLVVRGIASDKSSFLTVQLPVELSKVPQALYATGRNRTEGSDDERKKATISGIYVAVEHAELIDNGQKIQWQTATASDAKGSLPMWMQKMGIGEAVVKDVGMFMGFVADKRKSGVELPFTFTQTEAPAKKLGHCPPPSTKHPETSILTSQQAQIWYPVLSILATYKRQPPTLPFIFQTRRLEDLSRPTAAITAIANTDRELSASTAAAVASLTSIHLRSPPSPIMRHSARLEAKGIPNSSAPAESHTPPLMSPPGTKTPPTDPAKELRNQENHSIAKSLDIEAVSARLQQQQQHEESRRQRETTPGESPKRKKPRVYSDRMIPNRMGQDLKASYSLMHDDGSPATPSKYHRRPPPSELNVQKTEEANRLHSSILRREMFDDSIPQSASRGSENGFGRTRTPPVAFGKSPSTPHKNLFNYSSPHALTPRSISRSERGPNVDVRSDLYSLSPVKHASQTMLLSPRKTPRAVSKVPYKVLDAPELADDFYLNLVDWGATNVLAVGLGDSVYLWNSESGKVDQLTKIDGEQVTSVGWIQRGSHLAVGTSRGVVTVWDTVAKRRLRTMTGHSLRVSSMAWNQHILSTGSRDRTILHRDVRSPDQYFRKLVGHKQEICGLRWNHDTNQLASGGNDNKVFVWDGVDESWLYRWGEAEGGHKAAVKAVAWSPHTRGLLATGGGTADRCIKFWNTVTTNQHSANSALAASHARSGSINAMNFGELAAAGGSEPESTPLPLNPNLIRSHDTGSQVCNLMFSTLTSEIVSTHGYSQNAINIWKYPSMSQVVSLTGHTYRVLYLSMSPNGDTIVTGAGDETLRFWDVFGGKAKEKRESNMSSLVKEWGTIR